MSKLNDDIIAACKALGSPERVAEIYGVPLSTAKTVLRTKKPTFAMAERHIELSATPGALPSATGAQSVEEQIKVANVPADQRDPDDPPTSHYQGEIIDELVSKMSELIHRHGEVVTALSGMGDRFARIEAGLEASNISITQIQNYLSRQPNGTAVVMEVAAPPIRDGGYEHPELMSTTRPSRAPTIAADRMPTALPIFAAIPSLSQPPAPALAQGAVPIAAPPGQVNQAFDWLSPHGKAAPR